jgi:hypothetical protein
MTKGVLINDLELGYAPLSAYYFAKFIKEKEFHENVYDSHIYMIIQRKEITFSNFFLWQDTLELSFDIEQEGNPVIVRCMLPLIQDNIATDLSKSIELRLHNRKSTPEKKIGAPFKGTQAFTIQSKNKVSGEVSRLAQFTPDKLLQNYWKGHIRAKFSEDYSKMLEYKVHYVGKSTEQNICERLSSHSTFQEILTNQEPLSFQNIPSNEIMIMLYRIKDNNTIVKWGDDATPTEMSNYLLDYILPSKKTISFDAEKVLIKHLQPGYNRILYNSFPGKGDLVNMDYHNVILYGLSDPIKLIYNNGELKGGDLNERDYISVERI